MRVGFGFGVLAADRFGENAGDRGLADAAGAGKKVCLMNAIRFDRVHQRANDVALANDVRELRRTPFARQNDVRKAFPRHSSF